MHRLAFAVYTVVVGLGLGLAGNLLFYNKLVGLSFPLFIGLAVLVVFVSARQMQVTPLPRNLLPLLPLAFFGVMVAWRAEPLITLLNVLAVLCLGALALHYFPLRQPFDRDALADHGAGIGETVIGVLFAPFGALGESARWLSERRPRARGPLVAVGRGLLLALPVVIVFAVLLSAADTMFASLLEGVFSLVVPANADALFMQGTLTAVLGWTACGALAYGLGRALTRGEAKAPAPEAAPAVTEAASAAPPPEGVGASALLPVDDLGGLAVTASGAAAVVFDPPASLTQRPKKRALTLGMIESTMIIASVDLLFGAFVAIQFAYFFGGDAARELRGLTYAEYARRGFFELIAVSVLTLGLVLMLDWITVRHDRRQTRLFRALASALVALVGVMLVSASQRMLLYEEAFGFTHLRVYTHIFIGWLGVLFVFFLLALFRVREQIFSLGVLAVLVGYGVTLNLMNVESYIAERNIDRYLAGHELDIAYLYTFSPDAAPAMLSLYRTAPDDAIKTAAGQWLARQLERLDQERVTTGATIFSAHRSRDTAWALLDGARGELPVFDPYYYVPGTSRYRGDF
jgi:hypothetical protein